MLGLILITLLLGGEAQLSPLLYQHSWLYATPWRPLLPTPSPAPSLDTRQLSLGYTGPQTFPGTARQVRMPAPAQGRHFLLDLLRPAAAQGQFTLPFRPSPFAGYSNDEQQQQEEQEQEQPDQQTQLAQLEPMFHAPGYPQGAAPSKPVEETTTQPTQPGEDRAEHQQQQYIYMSPLSLYNLIRSLAPARAQ